MQLNMINKENVSASDEFAKASPAVEIKNIVFNYAAKNDGAAINGVSLQVKKGECLLLTGLSGCGKTSILRLMNALIPHYYSGSISGDVFINRESIAALPVCEVSKKVSTVFQNPKSQFFNLDTTSEILFFLENIGTPFKIMHERLCEIVSFLHIEHLLDRNIFSLSGGEKQLIAIASALASDTDIILFDEPTSNLDVFYIEKIAQVLKKLKRAGKTLIISEHRLYFLKDIIDRALIIKDGKIEDSFSSTEFAVLSEEKRKELFLRPVTLNSRVFERGDFHVVDNNLSSCKKMFVEKLVYRFPKEKTAAVDVENLSLSFGRVTALVGNSGQGKSSFAHCLSGITRANKDRVFICEEKKSASKRLDLSYLVMQDVGYQLFTESVEEEIALGKNKRNREIDTGKILSSLNLTELKDRHPLSLSGGQKQRVSVAAAIASGAKILIFDEPTSGMDYFHMKETAALINSVRADDRFILIISHDFEFLSLVADEMLLMEKGKIVLQTEYSVVQAEKIFELIRSGIEENLQAM